MRGTAFSVDLLARRVDRWSRRNGCVYDDICQGRAILRQRGAQAAHAAPRQTSGAVLRDFAPVPCAALRRENEGHLAVSDLRSLECTNTSMSMAPHGAAGFIQGRIALCTSERAPAR